MKNNKQCKNTQNVLRTEHSENILEKKRKTLNQRQRKVPILFFYIIYWVNKNNN